MSQVVGSNNSYKPITNTAWVCTRLCKLQKGCNRLAAASDKAYQLLAHCRWFSPASSTTKYCRHDIAEILLKVTLNTKNQSINQSIEFQQNADAPEGLESTVSSMFSFCANFWCIKSHFLIKCHAVYNGTSKALTHNTEKYCSE